DPDIHYEYNVEEKWKTDIVFLGAAKHSKIDHDIDRYNIVEKLSQMSNAKVYACFDRPATYGLDCFSAISGAKIGLGINIANDVYLYHSDRFINIPACGTFQLAKRFPGCELMFEDKKHLRYFDSEEEFFDLADYYLKHEDEREKITMAGMQHAHQEFNCKRIAKLLMDLIETGTYEAPWATIL
ncbi:MAG: glycosyltransferase family protein, partial [Planctomycetota bacterium]